MMGWNSVANIATAITAIVGLLAAVFTAVPAWRKMLRKANRIESVVDETHALVNSQHDELVRELKASQQYNKELIAFLKHHDFTPPTDET